MHKRRASEQTTPRATVAGATVSSSGAADVIEPSGSNFSYGVHLGVPSPDINDHDDTMATEVSDWLMEATVDLGQDLDTSKKELDIIKFILEEMELQPRADRRSNRTRQAQVERMRACREYSSSRCHMLRERLRQVQFWAHTRMIGEQWRLVDNQWRAWLSEQAGTYVNQAVGNRVLPLEKTSDLSDDAAWQIWGPLPYILSADIWWKGL
ncbi:hypothetical protein O1611_g1433 [Lasiodiplodia mahajangana]|uniref:Uncharacterized protein n=1 Tax=Lasiodiplodia mahajangana TaxID=1108764 RepID=A0ACC2JY28_9PEZI|nr:hypothetical protein O1611_g1433 [Lasiodiplodia mahajangana]